jgi:CDP-diacylglycerol--glycerol-3-phosphate 3-phosphatidyltransferase
MRDRNYYTVNSITIYRMVTAPVLFLLIITHRPDIFKWLLTVSFFTDAIDGYLARRYGVISILGSRLDSIADDLTIAAGIFGMIVLKEEFFRREIVIMVLLLLVFAFQTIFALVRYGRMSSFHTYTAKVAAFLQAIFLCSIFFFDKPIYLLFYVTASVTTIELVEEIILIFLLPQWKTDVKGLYWVISRKQSEESKNHFDHSE